MRSRSLFALLGLAGLVATGSLVVEKSAVPPEAIARAVSRDPATLDRAWRLPTASRFGRQVAWQTNGSLCGPASLANTFRSFGEPATTEGSVLAGTGRCRLGFCFLGLTLDELAEVARAHTGKRVTVLRDLTPEEFREHMRRSNEPGRRYIVNFDRAKLFGAGVGHYSPVGGYLEAEDLVLVLDVNPDFGPWLVERSRLFEAVNTLDGENTRGLLLIE